MDPVKLYAALIILVAIAIPLVAQPWIEAHEHRAMLAEKHGQLVDTETGKGIAGAQIIVEWTQKAKNSNCTLQQVVTTDENGRYAIADVSNQIQFKRTWLMNMLGALTFIGVYDVTYDWRLFVYKPGYMMHRDASDRQNAMGASWAFAPLNGFVEPRVDELDSTLVVQPIGIEKDNLPPLEQIIYSHRLVRALDCRFNVDAPPIAAIKRDIGMRIETMPCSLPGATVVDGNVAFAFASIVGRGIEKRLMPASAGRLSLRDSKVVTAEALCRAASEVTDPL